MPSIDIAATTAIERLRRLIGFYAGSADSAFTTSDAMGKIDAIASSESLAELILGAAAKAGAITPIKPGLWAANQCTEEYVDFIGLLAEVNAIILRHESAQAPPVAVEKLGLKTSGLLTEAEAAREAGVSQKTIRRCIKSGRLSAIDYGNGSKHLYRIESAALAALEPGAEQAASIPTTPRPRRSNRQVASSADAAASYLPRVSPSAKAGGRS